MMKQVAQRRDKLRRLVRRAGGDAILVTNFYNVTYLTGFFGDDSYLLVTRDGEIILSDFRYITQLAEECPGLDTDFRRSGQSMIGAVGKVVKAAKVKNLAIEADSMTVSLRERVEGAVGTTTLVPTSGLVEELREIKDKDEIREIRHSVTLAEKAFDVIRASMRKEQSEKEIAASIEHQIRLFGGTGCSFPPIVAVGPRAALPHATPTDRLVGESDFTLIDWGAFATRYASDLTRVLVTGKISPKLRRIYGVVLKAQLQAIAKIKPGVSMQQVDAAARGVIAKAGHAKHFGHGLGHGIGLEIHESTRLAAGQEGLLKPGMVITVEPGIYLPGWGGVRIEDDVLVTKDGHEVLSSVTKELDECVV